VLSFLKFKWKDRALKKKPDWKITGLEDVTMRLQGFLFLAEEEEGQGASGSLKSPTAAS
jgi:hypothetical protein